jgi:acyl-CoA dehydrogenase
MMDTVGNKAARRDRDDQGRRAAHGTARCIDWAIQATAAVASVRRFRVGAAYALARTLRFADGPDEVHIDQIARLELAKQTDLWAW